MKPRDYSAALDGQGSVEEAERLRSQFDEAMTAHRQELFAYLRKLPCQADTP